MLLKTNKYCLIFLIFLPFIIQGEYRPIKDLSTGFQCYHAFKDVFVPLTSNAATEQTLYFYLDVVNYRGAYLELCAPPYTTILVGNKILEYLPIKSCQYIDIDSLYRVMQTDSLLLTINNDIRLGANFSAHVVSHFDSPTILHQSFNQSSVRQRDEARHNFILITYLLIFLFLVYLIYTYSKFVKPLLSIRQLTLLNHINKNTTGYVFDKQFLTVLVYFSITLALLIIIWDDQLRFKEFGSLFEGDTLGWNLFGYLLLSVFIFLLTLTKYFLIAVVSNLFGQVALYKWHFMADFQFEFIIISYSAVITAALYLLNFQINIINGSILAGIVVGLFIIRLILLAVRIGGGFMLRNFLLFSYLCCTEIFPFILLVKISF